MNVVNVEKSNCLPNNEISSDLTLISNKVKTSPSPNEMLGNWIWANGSVYLEENNSLLNVDNSANVTFPANDNINRKKYYNTPANRTKPTFVKDYIYHFEVFLKLNLDFCSIYGSKHF